MNNITIDSRLRMAKNVADYIIDLLDKDKYDFQQLVKRTRSDWKYVLHHDIRDEMFSIKPEMELDIVKYVTIMNNMESVFRSNLFSCHDIPLINVGSSDEELQRTRTKIQELQRNRKQNPDILWYLTDYPACRIMSPHLQELIDYCKALGFNTYCSWGFSELKVFISWKHWSK